MRRALVLLIMLLLIFGSAACSSGSEATPEATATAGGSGSAKATISLADGWAIADVLSEAEVGEITGKTMKYFPEGASAAQNGKPKAGYTNDGQPNTKLFIGVDVAGGEECFELEKGFAEASSIKDLDGVGDRAVTCAWSDGNVGVLVLMSDAVIRIDWPAAVYGDDAAGMGGDLAKLLLSKMFA